MPHELAVTDSIIQNAPDPWNPVRDMSQESFLRLPAAEAIPGSGAALEIAPGIRWIRMPLPFALNHINLWLLRDRDEEGREGWTIVDCGITNDDTRAAWTQIFANELQGLPVLR